MATINNRLQQVINRHRAKMAAWHEENGSPKSVHFNIARLKRENAEGYTQAELGRDVIDTAKAQGREIERYR